MVVLYDPSPLPTCSGACGDVSTDNPVICHCLQVTHATIVEAIEAHGITTLAQLTCATGAGSGCTACHGRLRAYLAAKAGRHSAA